MNEKITLRKLCTKDLFPMMKILSKIHVREFKKCFENIDPKAGIEKIGIEVMLDAADVIFTNIGACEKDIYGFIADLSGVKPEEIAKLPMAEFAEIIIELVTKDEFRDFFTVLSDSKLLK